MSGKIFKVGDRVQHLATKEDHKGFIIAVHGYSVVVRWDDGKIGTMFFTRRSEACAWHLQKLPKWREGDEQDEKVGARSR